MGGEDHECMVWWNGADQRRVGRLYRNESTSCKAYKEKSKYRCIPR